MSEQYDLAVVGSGFSGSLLAMIARQLGLKVALLERGRHPRVVIGESSTPLSNLLLEELASKYSLPNIKPLTKWGSWQDSHPELACGLKRGFTFFHHTAGQNLTLDRCNQLLVAASPHDQIADTHWYRADVDHFFVQEAEKLGVDYIDEIELREFANDNEIACLRGLRKNRSIEFKARFVVDATGIRGFFHKALAFGERELPALPATETLYSHFRGVKPIAALRGHEIGHGPPYPVDDAAVHHVFDGGWVWILRFNNGITSAGIAATKQLAEKVNFAEGARAWERILQQIPAIAEQFASAEAAQPFRYVPQLGFRSAAITGPNWAMLPSAAGFVDPLLSTGFPLTLLGVTRLAEILEQRWGTENFNAELKRYAARTDEELLATARLIGALYANMNNFQLFTAVSLLYFAAASYSETVRRLRKRHLAQSFLLHDHPNFGPACKRVLERARSAKPGRESDELCEEVLRIIEPFDVAGLCNRSRRNWYPVEAEDLLNAAAKVEASSDEIARMLDRCGFTPSISQP